MFLAAAMSALKTLSIVVHLNSPQYTLIPQSSPCHGHLDEVPEMRGRDRSSGLLGEAINTGEYWRDGLRDVTPSHVDEYYFLIEAAERFLKDQPITEDDICPEDY
jgi:hypothetical protein